MVEWRLWRWSCFGLLFLALLGLRRYLECHLLLLLRCFRRLCFLAAVACFALLLCGAQLPHASARCCCSLDCFFLRWWLLGCDARSALLEGCVACLHSWHIDIRLLWNAGGASARSFFMGCLQACGVASGLGQAASLPAGCCCAFFCLLWSCVARLLLHALGILRSPADTRDSCLLGWLLGDLGHWQVELYSSS